MGAVLVGVSGLAGCARSEVGERAREDVVAGRNDAGAGATVAVAESYDAIKLRLLARAHEVDAARGQADGAAGGVRLSIEPPPGLDASLLRVLDDAEVRSGSARMTPLAEVLAELARVPGATTEAPRAESKDAESKDAGADAEALRLYAQGRFALNAGNAADAVMALEAAARIEPTSAPIWRSLGEAQIALSRRASGLSSLRRAVALGLNEPGTLFQLAREARKAGRMDEAGPMLARLLLDAGLDGAGLNGGGTPTAELRIDAARIDPGLAMLALLEASASLEATGRSRASIEALRMALSIPFEDVSQTTYRDEVAESMRYRSAQWMGGGDLAMRLGDAGLAREMYERAAEGTMLDPAPLLARRVYASLMEGNSARAALAVLGDIERMRGRVDERQIGLIEYVATHSDADLLARAIAALAQGSVDGVELTATTRSRLALAQAAALMPAAEAREVGRSANEARGARARQVLEQALTQDAFDVDLLIALAQAYPDGDAQGLAQGMARVVANEPLAANAAASAVIADGRMVREVAEVTPREGARDVGMSLFAAAILVRTGREEEALALVRPVADGPDAPAGALAAAIGIAMENGAWDDATRWADALAARGQGDGAGGSASAGGSDAGLDAGLARAKVFGLSAAFRRAEAKAAADVLVRDPSAKVRDLIMGAEMALSVGDVRQAEALVRAAMARDVFDERGYEAALQLHGPRGAAPSQTKVAQAGAALRQAVPASRLIRLVATQELASRSLWKQAAEAAAELLEPRAESTNALDVFVTGVERSADTDPAFAVEAEAMLRARVAARPQSPALRIALARVLAAMDRGVQAEAELEAGLALIGARDLARARERVVRDALADPARADALALARLEASPRSIENTIELAQFRVRKGEYSLAAAALRGGLPPSIALPMSQTARLVVMVEGLTVDEVAKRSSEAAMGALELLDVVASRPDVRLPEQIDATRVALVAQSDPTNARRLLEACADLARRHPRLGLPTYARVAEVLLAREDAGPALEFLRGACAAIEPVNEDLLFEVYRLTVLRGSRADYIALADAFADPERLTALIGAITQGRPAISDVDELRAEVLYLVANALSSIEKVQEAYDVYDEVLRRVPRHAWTNNNYGYALLTREKDFARAKGMIEIAYAERPEEASIVDSMGWVRYHEGKLEDWKDEATGEAKPGALTLLEQAASEADEDSTPEVYTHLGDALWRMGRKEEAVARWDMAAKVGRIRLAEFDAQRNLRAQQAPDAGGDAVESRYVNELRVLVEAAEARSAAVRDGKDPEIDPQIGIGAP